MFSYPLCELDSLRRTLHCRESPDVAEGKVIVVNTMSNYTATIIRTGNSYALRVPKSYIENSKLELGQKVQIGARMVLPKEYDPEAVKRAVRNLQAIGAFSTIKDPVAWQREIRKDRSLPGRD